MAEPTVIRRAEIADAGDVAAIYNEAILTTTATFDIDPKTVADREIWLMQRSERYPVLVAETDDGVVGFASLTPWSERAAYDATAETALYVASSHRNRGIGRQLKQAIIAEAEKLGFHTLIARVTTDSEASLHLNREFGFVHVGTLREVGRKFDRMLDVCIMQKLLRQP